MVAEWDVGQWLTDIGAHQDPMTNAIRFPNGNVVTMMAMRNAGDAGKLKHLLLEAASNIPHTKPPVALPDASERSRFWFISFVEEDGRKTPSTTAMSPLADKLVLDGVQYNLIEWDCADGEMTGYALFERVKPETQKQYSPKMKYYKELEEIKKHRDEYYIEKQRKFLSQEADYYKP